MDQEAIQKPKHKKHNQTQASSNETLPLPGLPNHLAQLCLAKINPSILFSVCHSWRRLIYSPSFPPFFSLYALLSPPPDHNPNSPIQFSSLDPISNTWTSLPSPPSDLLSTSSTATRPSSLENSPSRRCPSPAALSSSPPPTTNSNPRCLVLLCSNHCPTSGPSAPRCPSRAVGVLPELCGGKVYVASGMGTTYRGDVARSMEEWDMRRKEVSVSWVKKAGLKDGRFSREAVEAIGYRGEALDGM
ncbi:F-box/kelch-repeat protein SKIP25 [Prunus yedoensis var. nudiflora]|uniref:F-box/kelch-repeat protein SKIP25 n=1 Tax=Prunus yedoensis var. nudiflora TaxID=2094558 RepID=A0A314UJG1_PRUYE|nr:F-box/kelch-repeat protein SKIP25 [Prunus yedoensis var. nudiflora]